MSKIRFSIPGFHCYYRLNMTLLELMQAHTDWFDPDVEIVSTYDCFPGQIWNGGRGIPVNKMPLMNVKSVLESYQKYHVGMYFTYTNPFITTEELLTDAYCNEITEMSESEQNGVIVASPIMNKLIELAYPKMNRIYSTTKDLGTAEKVNKMCEEYDFVVPSFHMNNRFQEIAKLSHPDKVAFLCDEACTSSCPNRLKEYELIARDNMTMMSQTTDKNEPEDIHKQLQAIHAVCGKKAFFPDMLQLPTFIRKEDMKGKYADLGVTYFKLSGRNDPIINLIEAYVYYFAKDEYKDIVRNVLLNFTLAMPMRLMGSSTSSLC